MQKNAIAIVSLCMGIVSPTYANEWANNVDVIKVGTYQDIGTHFVWLSSGIVAECQATNPSNPTLLFNEQAQGGKAIFAVLLTAIAAQRKIDVQVSGCNIVEVYFR